MVLSFLLEVLVKSVYLVCKFSDCTDIASLHYLALVWGSSQMKGCKKTAPENPFWMIFYWMYVMF